MNDTTTIALSLTCLAIGALLGWLATRARQAAQVETAVVRAEAVLQMELAQLREHARATETARAADEAEFVEFKREANGWRHDLNTQREEAARLTERASRVLPLDAKVVELDGQLRASNAEGLRLSGEVARLSQALTSSQEQVTQLGNDNAELEGTLRKTTDALNAANERKATLGEQAARLPDLETKLTTSEQLKQTLNTQLTELRESSSGELSRLKTALTGEREAGSLVREDLGRERDLREKAETDVARLSDELTELRTRAEAERTNAERQLQLLLEAKEVLTNQFKSLASDILEEKSKRFAEQNQTTLGQMLDPLRTQLNEFKGKVEEVYVQEGKDRSALSEQVRQLVGLNQELSQDAKNLTLALKGSTKTQGNWGELVLERVLEASGLRKGHEYHVQESQAREDGSRAQADVVVNLPEERRLVVDAKVSLVAYETHLTADTDEARAQAVRRHLESVRSHIKGLSGKRYEALYGLKSLDFVLMFVPIEPAFMMAVTHDGDLFMDAWNKNVLLVSPSTLLFVVRTVAHLWRQEAQTRNAQEIAKRGAELYDRLVAFVDDLQTVGARLKQAQSAYEDAHKKLTTNRGNVIRQAEMLRGMGVKPTKVLPPALVEQARGEDDEDAHPVGSPLGLPASVPPDPSPDSSPAPDFGGLAPTA